MSKFGANEGESVQGTVSAEQQNLYRRLKQSADDRHFGLFYKTHERRLEATLPFVRLGLERHERCLYLAGDRARDDIIEDLETLDASVDAAIRRDQLRILPGDRILSKESIDAHELLNHLDTALAEARRDGFEGLRVVKRIPWAEDGSAPFEEFLEYRSGFRTTTPEGVTALCQHSLCELPDERIVDIAQLYPTLIYRGKVCDNPYHTPPSEVREGGRPPLRAERLLETTYDLATARDAIRQREQRVAVLNRVLRHNLRNEMNVIQSHAELIEERTTDPDIVGSVAKIRETVRRLMDISEDARRVQQIADSEVPERVPHDLETTVEEAVERTQTHYPAVKIDRDVAATWIEASRELELAFTELFKRLAESAGGECRIEVEGDLACGKRARECVVVHCEEAALPDSEIEPLVEGIETQLRHSSGLGLWLANWIVELSGGDLTFEESGDTVVLSLPAAGTAGQ